MEAISCTLRQSRRRGIHQACGGYLQIGLWFQLYRSHSLAHYVAQPKLEVFQSRFDAVLPPGDAASMSDRIRLVFFAGFG